MARHSPPTDVQAIKQDIADVEKAIAIVETNIDRERASLQHDRFGRRASEMPTCLRHLYEHGDWRHHQVYLWPRVLSISALGHTLASSADAALDRLRYQPNGTLPSHPAALTDDAVRDAAAVATSVSDRVRKVLATTGARREAARHRNARAYMLARRQWMNGLAAAAARENPRESLRRDRELLIASRAMSGMGGGMTDQEIDVIFGEIDAAGGTAGGIERWGRSITTIPDHQPNQLPAAADGGGVLVDNPLAAHYASRNINPWTRAERLLFLEKFLVYGKNFRKVATFFEHKSCEDAVRFYFDNKKQLKLKQLVKENSLRKKGNRKAALIDLSKLPRESRSIQDNFMHLQGFESDEDDEDVREFAKAEKLSLGTVGRGWSPADRRALIFALCRIDVTHDEETKAAPVVWTNIAALVGSKTPRQCRQFYFEYKSVLGLEGYRPPPAILLPTINRRVPAPLKRVEPPSHDPADQDPLTEPSPKQVRRELNMNGTTPPPMQVVTSSSPSLTQK